MAMGLDTATPSRMAPSPTTTAMNPNASPKPDCIDFSTAAGAIPAKSPSAILEISSARNACSLTTRNSNSSRTMEPSVRYSRPGPAAGILSQSDLGFEPDEQHQHEHHACPRQRQGHNDTDAPDVRQKSQAPGREHATRQRERKNAGEESRMIIRKFVADALRDQRVDTGKAASYEQRAHACAKKIVGSE